MDNRMTQEDLQAIKEWVGKVANSPFAVKEKVERDGIPSIADMIRDIHAELVAQTNLNVPRLIAEVERLQREVDTLTIDRNRWEAQYHAKSEYATKCFNKAEDSQAECERLQGELFKERCALIEQIQAWQKRAEEAEKREQTMQHALNCIAGALDHTDYESDEEMMDDVGHYIRVGLGMEEPRIKPNTPND
jgi:hypothetical protein